MKPWQKGFELDELRAFSAPFQTMKPFVFGAFGLPKERDVAAALAAGELLWLGKPPLAAAIFKRLVVASTHEDFKGDQVTIPAGAIFLKAVGGELAAVERILRVALARAPGEVWLELFEELPGMRDLALALGFERKAAKVSAASELKGLYAARSNVVAAPLDPVDELELCCLAEELLSAGERARVLEELAAYAPWEQHYSSYNKRQSWTAFALYGFDQTTAAFIEKPAEMSRAWKAEHPDRLAAVCGPTPAAARFPFLVELLRERLGAPWQRLRFMRLRAEDGELSRHADIIDPEAGTRDGQLVRLHIPLQTAPGVRFSGWSLDGPRRDLFMHEGGLFALDTRKPHAVKNESPGDRIHVVADVFSSPALRKLLAAGRRARRVDLLEK